MARQYLSILVVTLVLFPLAAVAQQSRGIGVVKKDTPTARPFVKGEYRALLIGNNDYQSKKWPPLKTAVNDVTAFREVLVARYGFAKENVILRTNATRRDMLGGFNQLAKASGPSDNVVIYYAGHGQFDKDGRGWWVPVDGEDNTDYISNDEILGRLRSIKAKHKLLIVDSCFSGNLLTRGVVTVPKARRLPSRYVVEKTALASVQGLSSGGKEPVSDGGPKWGGNSIFAYHLLGRLKANQKPYLSAQLLGYEISESVANDTASLFGTGQTPVFSPIKAQGDQGGDFFFVPDPSTLVDSGAKLALVFIQEGGDSRLPIEGAHKLVAKRLRENLRALYVPLADKVYNLPRKNLTQTLPDAIRKAEAELALVVELSAELKKQHTLMWQGHSTMALKLQAFRLENGRLVPVANYELGAQRLPMRKWSDDPAVVADQLGRTVEKVFKKTSQRKLNEFLESVRN